jgi:hypothetical protein
MWWQPIGGIRIVIKHSEKAKVSLVAIGGLAAIGITHMSCQMLLAFTGVANACRNSLVAVIVVLTALLSFAGLAQSQEPARAPSPPRTRLLVGLTQSPPFCMRDEDGFLDRHQCGVVAGDCR